jgi:hypothetical protein
MCCQVWSAQMQKSGKAEGRWVRLKQWIVARSQRKKIEFSTTFIIRLWARREEIGKWVNGTVYMIKQWKNNHIMWKSGILLLYAPNGNQFRAPISQNHPIAWRDYDATAQSWHNPRENTAGIDTSACDIVSRVIVLGDQADGGNDDAPVRRVGRSW